MAVPSSSDESCTNLTGRLGKVVLCYRERQEGSHCGRHALNNIIGRKVCTQADFNQAKGLFEQEHQRDQEPFDPATHFVAEGNYSIDFLAWMLQVHAAKGEE